MLARGWLPRAVSLGLVAVVVVAACTDDDTATPTPPTTPATTTTEPVRVNDGVLRLGLLLPKSGEGATIGQPLIDAAGSAVDQINAAGGVLGQRVELEPVFDEGNNAATASEAISQLLERDVDAVIGPASSTVALATLDELMSRDVLTCSPTATAIALEDYPDSELFFRTAPSDSLQAEAIAQYAERTGARTAAVAYLDDAYGRPFEAATTEALGSRGLAVLGPVAFAADEESLTDQAAAISESDAGVIIVIGNGEQGMLMLTELSNVASRFPGGEPPEIIVNDAIRRPPSTQLVQALDPAVREQVTGVSPLAIVNPTDEPAGPFATNAFDCVNLIALSAAQANSDSPRLMATQMVEASNRGTPCRSFAECNELLDDSNSNIDYDGPGGVVAIGPDGDPAQAWFDLFDFNDQGVDVSRAPMMVPR